MNDPQTSREPRWDEQARLLVDLALSDLDSGCPVLPTLVAFAGDRPLFLATLRDFDKGAHGDAIIEVGALAIGLGADRLALSLSGRAWSLRDPIPPVLGEGADLRQPVICVHTAAADPHPDGGDDHGDDPRGGRTPPTVLSTLVPYDVHDDGTVTSGEPICDEAGEGWVPRALAAMVTAGPETRDDDEDIGRQILRCEALGHRLAWASELVATVERLRLLPLGSCWTGASSTSPGQGSSGQGSPGQRSSGQGSSGQGLLDEL